jgi:hypothetical protein
LNISPSDRKERVFLEFIFEGTGKCLIRDNCTLSFKQERFLIEQYEKPEVVRNFFWKI